MKQGWEIKKLGEVATYVNGYAFKPEHWGESGVPIIRIQNLNNPNAEYNYCDADIPEKFVVKDGDILISWSASLGVYEWNRGKAYLNQHIFKVVFNKVDINKYFLKYAVNAKLNDMLKDAHGATMKHIVKGDFDNTIIPYPPREEQEKIVEELDCLSGVIEKKKQQLKELNALAQSIFYTMFGNPISNEKGWKVKKLGEVGKVITGNTPSTKDEENYSSNDYCFVKPSDIGKDYVTNIEKTEFYISDKAFSQSRKLCKGSVLTTCIGIIGKVGILKVDATCNQQINAIQPNDNYISEYVAWAIYLTRSVIEEIANAPVVPIINKGEFSNIVIPLPPKDLQQKFADKIEAIEKQKALIKQSIAQTEELFNSRMSYYFN
jgi:type I restriction enzyme S subunit